MKRVFPANIQSGMSQSGSYVLMLVEPESGVQVPIFIGSHEAQCILLAQEMVQTRRPMTHELMQHMMEDFGLQVTGVTIDRMLEGIFYATVRVSDGFNEKQFDSRCTDAITMALMWACPIMMDEKVIEEAGMLPDADSRSKGTPTLQELEEELQRCEEKEDYERAAEIMKQINEINNRI